MSEKKEKVADRVRRWKNKKNNKEFKATPWWEIPPGDDELAVVEMEVEFGNKKHKVPTKMGVMYQVGWLIQNEHGIWFGLNLEAAEQFEDLGPYERKMKDGNKQTGTASGLPQAD